MSLWVVLDQPTDQAPPDPPADVIALVFTGRGGEYFRIWVVNVFLTLVSFGIYTAWAKVRKARYFRQNTRLDKHVFDYHGKPAAILRGRLVALVLLAAYTWAFEFSNAAGTITLVMLCAIGPWLFMRAQQFSLGNTSFRGLRFGFQGELGEAYRTVLPVLVLWLAPTVAAAFGRVDSWQFWSLTTASALGWPWMHHRLKAYQLRNAFYGDRRFAFTPCPWHFFWLYVKGFVLVVLGIVTAAAITTAATWSSRREPDTLFSSPLLVFLYGALLGLVAYVAAWPYLAARLQQVVWTRTQLGDMRFRTEIKARPLFRLVLTNVTLTILSLGLYWPWAAVALARYRIECVRVESITPVSQVAMAIQARPVSAAGDSAADAFGFDVGL